MYGAIETWLDVGVLMKLFMNLQINGVSHKAAEVGLLNECCELNGCKVGECKVTLSHKLLANYEFHTVEPTDKWTECLCKSKRNVEISNE